MENLNHDVLENILLRLPLGTDSSQAKRVCKSWKTILDCIRHNEVGFLFACHDCKNNEIQLYFGEEYDRTDCNMINYHYSRETLMEMEHCRFSFKDYPNYLILVGSCNGLVCIQEQNLGAVTLEPMLEPFTVCNPLTGEFIFLAAGLCDDVYKASIGFGYCQSTNEYKVVRLYNPWNEESLRAHIQVYTVGHNAWRHAETTVDMTSEAPGTFVNGVLHWLDDDADPSKIVTFDLEDEKVRDIPLPPVEVLERLDSHNELKLMGGNLCWVQYQDKPSYFLCFNIGMKYNVDIWSYKRNKPNTNNTRYNAEELDHKPDYYTGNSWNWVKHCSINSIECCHKPFAILKSNEVLLLGNKNFYCYDPKTKTIHKLGDDNDMGSSSYIETIPHANSYVSLKDSGETWYGPEY